MGFFDDIDEKWKGKRILVKGDHPQWRDVCAD